MPYGGNIFRRNSPINITASTDNTQKLEKWQPILMIGSEAEFDFNQGMCTYYNISTFQNMTSDSTYVYNK